MAHCRHDDGVGPGLEVGRDPPADGSRELGERLCRRAVAERRKERLRQLRLDEDLDRPFRGAGALRRSDPHHARFAVRQRAERLADDDRLGAGAADPTDDGAVGQDDRAVAAACGGRTLDVDDRRENERFSRRRELAGADQDFAHSAIPTAAIASHTRSGMRGISMLRTPAYASASTTAFTYAAGEPTVADSPTPLQPIGWCGDGVTVS